MKLIDKIKCFLGFHKPSSTISGNSWTKEERTICCHCRKEYVYKRGIE